MITRFVILAGGHSGSTLVSGILNLAEMVAKDHAITGEEIIQNLGHHVAVWNEGLVE